MIIMIIDRYILCVNAAYAQSVATKTEAEQFLLSAADAAEVHPEAPQPAHPTHNNSHDLKLKLLLTEPPVITENGN